MTRMELARSRRVTPASVGPEGPQVVVDVVRMLVRRSGRDCATKMMMMMIMMNVTAKTSTASVLKGQTDAANTTLCRPLTAERRPWSYRLLPQPART